MKKLSQKIVEASQPDSNLIRDIKEIFDKSYEEYGEKNLTDFLTKFVEKKDDYNLYGFVTDSDKFDFYTKYDNDIDAYLNDINFFDKIPSKDLQVFSSYKYIIESIDELFVDVARKQL